MPTEPTLTYHLALRADWESRSPTVDYAPLSLDREGFIHCTNGVDELVATANRHYREVPGDFLVLVLDRTRIKPIVRYDDPAQLYPHIHGPLNRDAIVRVVPLPRLADGHFPRMREWEP